jgi:hypothetical protein
VTRGIGTARAGRTVLLAVVILAAVAWGRDLTHRPTHGWTLFLVNFLFWTGLGMAGVTFAALLELTRARWAGPVREMSGRFARSLPVIIGLYLVWLVGAPQVLDWMDEPPMSRRWWLHPVSVRLRDGGAIALFAALALGFLRAATRPPDRRGDGARARTRYAVALVLAYAVGLSVLAIDLVMTLEPEWTSTLFPAYFFVGALYGGVAAVTGACALQRASLGEAGWLDDRRSRDLGRLLLGLSLLWTYLFWSQFLVIWYGNLPEEYGFLLSRIEGPWGPLAWTVLGLCFIVPFVALSSRAAKRPIPLALIAGLVLAGLWGERLLLVAPARLPAPNLDWRDALTTAGFLALFLLTLRAPRRLEARGEPAPRRG